MTDTETIIALLVEIRDELRKMSEKKSPQKSSAKKFVIPTLPEVEAYCLERRNTVDPDAFVAHYQANGWKVGKVPMKDWKAAVRTWEKSDYGNGDNAQLEAHKRAVAAEQSRHEAEQLKREQARSTRRSGSQDAQKLNESLNDVMRGVR